jgi:hypothetical protein
MRVPIGRPVVLQLYAFDGGTPVHGDYVQAKVVRVPPGQDVGEPPITVDLVDNGIVDPYADLEANDGVHSAVFQPSDEGLHQVAFVFVDFTSGVVRQTGLSFEVTAPLACGDADGNGSVEDLDARLVQACAVGRAPCRGACDPNRDGTCDTLDAREIWQHVSGVQLIDPGLDCDLD